MKLGAIVKDNEAEQKKIGSTAESGEKESEKKKKKKRRKREQSSESGEGKSKAETRVPKELWAKR